MTTKPDAARSPAEHWRRELRAALVVAAGVFVSTCTFAGIWAVTHPAPFGV